ncbi:MAG: signal peptidase I [Gammaproteobacteria bacterium]
MDFSAILLLLVALTGAITGGHRLLLLRARGAPTAEPERPPPPPLLVEYARAFFPVLLLVFALRSFVVEPFRIPSGSMLPSLHIGDFILVNKFSYGLRIPVWNRKIIPLGAPERGDVMVFRYPRDPSLNFIKRVVGLPGDVIAYRGKKLFINDREVARREDGEFYFGAPPRAAVRHIETIGDSAHTILLDPEVRARDARAHVPLGHYFVMGDNRDHSNDSRYWRFVPESHVAGKAFFIWFSWKRPPGAGIRWSRIGNRIR